MSGEYKAPWWPFVGFAISLVVLIVCVSVSTFHAMAGRDFRPYEQPPIILNAPDGSVLGCWRQRTTDSYHLNDRPTP